jgi:hypothetical protein
MQCLALQLPVPASEHWRRCPAGKSTLATALAERLQLPVHYEPVLDNAYLEDFYADMSK